MLHRSCGEETHGDSPVSGLHNSKDGGATQNRMGILGKDKVGRVNITDLSLAALNLMYIYGLGNFSRLEWSLVLQCPLYILLPGKRV